MVVVVVAAMCVVAMVTVTMVMITTVMVAAMVHVVGMVIMVSMVTVTMVMMPTSPMMEDKYTNKIYQEAQNGDHHETIMFYLWRLKGPLMEETGTGREGKGMGRGGERRGEEERTQQAWLTMPRGPCWAVVARTSTASAKMKKATKRRNSELTKPAMTSALT